MSKYDIAMLVGMMIAAGSDFVVAVSMPIIIALLIVLVIILI